MKRLEKNIRFACLAALAIGFAACSQDELSPLTGGTEGTPVTFTAAGLAMPQVETRATVDGTWDDALSVAIKIGNAVKEYTATPYADEPNKANLVVVEGETPFYWTTAAETKTVNAWYPYTAGETSMPAEVVVQQDQSIEANYLASDLLSATPKKVSYDDTALEFKHRTAKISIHLEAAVGSTATFANSQVLLYNLSITNGNPANILCYSASDDGSAHHALVAPQTFAANKEFLRLILADGAVHNYVSGASIEFEAGYQYVFTITVTDTGIKVKVDEAIPWDDGVSSENGIQKIETDDYICYDVNGQRHYYVKTEAGLKVWAEYTNQGNWGTNLTLMNNITMTKPEDGSSNWTPIGRRESSTGYDTYTGTIDGNGYTIDNMVVDDPNEYYATMVVALGVGGTIQNLSIGNGSHFMGSNYASSIAARNYDGKVINCHSAAKVEGRLLRAVTELDFSVAGIVGVNRCYTGNSYVIGCSFSGQLIADANQMSEFIYIGGVVATNTSSSGNGYEAHVVGCASSGSVLMKNANSFAAIRVGGVVGGSSTTGSDVANASACAMTGTMSFENVTSTNINTDAAIGRLYSSTASHVYWTPGSIDADWQQPYRTSSGTYDTLMEVDGSNITWATAVNNMNAAIETWNAANGNLCPVHYVLTGNKPVLMKNQE